MIIDMMFGMMLAFFMVAFCYWFLAPLCLHYKRKTLQKLFMHIEVPAMYLLTIILFIYYIVRWSF